MQAIVPLTKKTVAYKNHAKGELLKAVKAIILDPLYEHCKEN